MSPLLDVLHLDHTRVAGGAEIALVKMLTNNSSWQGTIAVPACKRDGAEPSVFSPSQDLRIVQIGPEQTAGASSAGIVSSLKFGLSILGQVIGIKLSQSFRQSSLIHANTSRAGVYGALACFLTKKAFVVHLRDIIDEDSLGKLGRTIFIETALRRADGVIANSQASLESVRGKLKKSALAMVIPSPAGLVERGTPAAIRREVIDIGMVARIDPWKGQKLLIESFADVFRGRNATLHLAGSPAFGHESYLEELKQLVIKLRISSQVNFAGHVENVHKFISNMDICVQSSIRPEPLGQNVLQYLAAGRPTIASNEGGPIEWISDHKNGILFDARSRESLAESLSLLDQNYELRKRISDGTQHINIVPTDSEVIRMHGLFFNRVHEAKMSKYLR